MALTSDERKRLLGHGGLTKIARRLGVTPGHLSEVNRNDRPDDKARRAIAREIARKHPHIAPADVWPQQEQHAAAV